MNELGVVCLVHLLFRYYYAPVFVFVFVAAVAAWSTLLLVSHFSDLEPARKKRRQQQTRALTFFCHNPQHFTLCKFDLQDSMLHENCLHTFGWVQTRHHNCHEQFTFVLFRCMYAVGKIAQCRSSNSENLTLSLSFSFYVVCSIVLDVFESVAYH